MTDRQKFFYFGLWNSVVVEQGWCDLSAAEKTRKRRAMHARAGCPESSKSFTNRDFDRFKALCEAIIAGKNFTGCAKADADGARRSFVWRIKTDAKKSGLAPEYITAIARDLYALGNWEDLDLASLKKLMLTIHNRAGAKLGKDTRSHADVVNDNEPF